MDDTGLDAWLVANLPEIGIWIGLGLAILGAVCRTFFHFGRDAREWDDGFRDGQRMRRHYGLDKSDDVC